MGEVRAVTEADRRAAGITLGRAFADDHVFEWLLPRQSDRARRAARFFAAHVGTFVRLGSAWAVDGGGQDLAGVALWAPPKRWRLTARDMAREAPGALRSFRLRSLRAALGMRAVEKAHPHEPHWYLAVLGTDPDRQGQGIGSTLVTTMLERCDREGVAAYLESSKESNIPFYARHGFVVREAVQVGWGGPKVWPMWRDPR